MKTVNSVHTHVQKHILYPLSAYTYELNTAQNNRKSQKINFFAKNCGFDKVIFSNLLLSFYFCSQGNIFDCNRKNNSNLHAKNVTCLKSKEAEMVSTIDINSNSNMSAQEKLEQIQHPVENLQLTLSTLTKMSLDVSLTAEELTALLTTLHKQVVDIQRAIEA